MSLRWSGVDFRQGLLVVEAGYSKNGSGRRRRGTRRSSRSTNLGSPSPSLRALASARKVAALRAAG